MENLRLFAFSTNVKGVPSRISFSLPTESSFVITNQYRPNLYSQISSPFVNVQAGEGIKDFYDDCCNILATAGRSLEEGVNALVDGLNAVIKAHIARCGNYLCWSNQLAIANKSQPTQSMASWLFHDDFF